jgi:dihydropteroate synthase
MQKVDAEVRRIIDEQYALARRLIEDNQDKMHAMAKALLEWETIDSDQLDDIMAGKRAASAQGLDTRARPGGGGGSGGTPGGHRPGTDGSLTGPFLPPARAQSRGLAPRFVSFMIWQTTRYSIDLTRPRVMGIVNVTPDSFSDGGRHRRSVGGPGHCERCCATARTFWTSAANPPGPARRRCRWRRNWLGCAGGARGGQVGVPFRWIPTSRVMQAVLDLGADIINDIWALRQPGAAEVVARHPSCGVCLMHMHRDPLTMQVRPWRAMWCPGAAFLSQAAAACASAGGGARAHRAGPGHRFRQDRGAEFQPAGPPSELLAEGFPLLVGWSRKSSLGAATASQGTWPRWQRSRLVPSVAAALLAVERGARHRAGA